MDPMGMSLSKLVPICSNERLTALGCFTEVHWGPSPLKPALRLACGLAQGIQHLKALHLKPKQHHITSITYHCMDILCYMIVYDIAVLHIYCDLCVYCVLYNVYIYIIIYIYILNLLLFYLLGESSTLRDLTGQTCWTEHLDLDSALPRSLPAFSQCCCQPAMDNTW